MKINPITKISIQRNSRKLLTTTFFALSLLGLSNINSCSKMDKFEKEIKEQNDTIEKKDFIFVDDTSEEITHEILLTSD